MKLRPDTPVQFLKGVGPRRAEQFEKIGVRSVEDLLYHIPHRYLDATSVTPIAKLSVGDDVTVVGEVVSTGIVPTRQRRLKIFRAVVRDSTGVIECAWPGQPFLERVIRQGQTILVSGPVKFYHGRQLAPREQLVLDDGKSSDTVKEGMVLPVYRATAGLSHKQIRTLIAENLDALLDAVVDPVPRPILKSNGLLKLRDAFEVLHRPRTAGAAEEGRRRLAFDELLDLQIVMTRARQLASEVPKGPTFTIRKDLTTRLKETLPFELTPDQVRSVREITSDMVSDRRMHRLLMGDVGTGKTIVSLFAIMLALENGYQAVLMAPTELLAEQHARTLARFALPIGVTPDLLLGRFSASEKEAVRARIASGESRLIIGTHALIQGSTELDNLGLVVIDEQHRFGVEQRAALIEKGESPDVLLLSATPIPRSLALTLYGDLDISTIKTKPAGRIPVETTVRGDRDRRKVYDFVASQCRSGRQAYVVYPVIEESEKTDLKAATTMSEELQRELSPLVVGLVHGRIKSDEREHVMRRFRDGDIDILVATTVIEVGIDVPNATVMVVEHPERFGLAQLHQLRGRVGRGADRSYCVLLAPARADRGRLKAFADTDDGFRIAELDLGERGMGELAGARQSGGVSLRFTDLAEDSDMVQKARATASEVIAEDPTLSSPGFESLRKRIERRYERGLELFRVG